MKLNLFRTGLFSVCLFLLTACSSTKQTTNWFKKGPWYNGLSMVPYQGIDKKEFERQYQKNSARWDLAFKYLKETDLKNVAPGKYPLDGDNVFVSVTEGPGKDFDKASWESHRKLVDIQCVVSGKEKMGHAHLSDTKVLKPYDEKRDVANYTAEGKYYIAEPGVMYIFYPNDAHRPSIKVERDQPIKKVVIKVRYTK